MYKFDHKLLPETFSNMFSYNTEIHTYNTRLHSYFHVPRMRLTIGQKSLKYIGVKIWNYFVSILGNTPVICSFKKNYKTILKLSQFVKYILKLLNIVSVITLY
jgi:hypothetical protein